MPRSPGRPPSSRLRGYTYAYSLSRDTPYLGKTDESFTGISTWYPPPPPPPFSTWPLGIFFHLTPYLGNIMVGPTRIPLLLFSLLFFALGKYFFLFYHQCTLEDPTTDIYNRIRALPPFVQRLYAGQGVNTERIFNDMIVYIIRC